jgi:hypothetical protein
VNEVEKLQQMITVAFLRARRTVRHDPPSEGQIILSFLFVAVLVVLAVYLFMPGDPMRK